MLTNLTIRNFKQFDEVNIELGPITVLVGPNNSGKTTVLQALALWDVATLDCWAVEQGGAVDENAAINRLDLLAIPVPNTNLLWRNLLVGNGDVVRLEVIVAGTRQDETWSLGFRFHYGNSESLYCESIPGLNSEAIIGQTPAVTFLQPISGLAAIEPRIEQGRIKVLVGEGRTAEILRNVCYRLYEADDSASPQNDRWHRLTSAMRRLFGITLLPPDYIAARGEIRMAYADASGIKLDISAAGRGMLQTLLLLAYMYSNPGAVLLLDEPDAHLEVLRQREMYQLLAQVARELGSQIILTSHSEIVLDEASDRDLVVAFVGTPHRIDDRGSLRQVKKALREIGFDQYYQAEQRGWVLYLEGPTDLAILREFAELLQHSAAQHALASPFVHYVSNQPGRVGNHFFALREAAPRLRAIALFDNLRRELRNDLGDAGEMLMWQRNEIENYFGYPDVVLRYVAQNISAEADTLAQLETVLRDNIPPAAYADTTHRYWQTTKVSDDLLTPIFDTFFRQLALPNLMQKTDFHVLVRHLQPDQLDPEVSTVLDAIANVAQTR